MKKVQYILLFSLGLLFFQCSKISYHANILRVQNNTSFPVTVRFFNDDTSLIKAFEIAPNTLGVLDSVIILHENEKDHVVNGEKQYWGTNRNFMHYQFGDFKLTKDYLATGHDKSICDTVVNTAVFLCNYIERERVLNDNYKTWEDIKSMNLSTFYVTQMQYLAADSI